MERHESIVKNIRIREFTLDAFIVHILRNRIVDVKKCNRSTGNASSNIFRKRAENINFAGNRNSAGSKAAVHIARLKSEFLRKCRPAFVCENCIFFAAFVCFNPVKKCKFKLCHAWKKIREVVSARTKLFFHVSDNFWNSFVVFVGAVCNKKVKFRIFLNFNSNVIKSLDWRIASKKVLRARSECDKLEIFKTDNCACNRNKFFNHLYNVVCCSNWIFWDYGRNFAQVQIV